MTERDDPPGWEVSEEQRWVRNFERLASRFRSGLTDLIKRLARGERAREDSK